MYIVDCICGLLLSTHLTFRSESPQTQCKVDIVTTTVYTEIVVDFVNAIRMNVVLAIVSIRYNNLLSISR